MQDIMAGCCIPKEGDCDSDDVNSRTRQVLLRKSFMYALKLHSFKVDLIPSI
jgi:hypothetical protein